MDALKETWKQFPSAYLRLIAMGIDAYNLATRLDNLETDPYPGATGNLSLTADQRIQRKLICAKFMDGQPEISDFALRIRTIPSQKPDQPCCLLSSRPKQRI